MEKWDACTFPVDEDELEGRVCYGDLDLLTIGMVNDLFCERQNDEYNGYRELATQEDMDLF